MKSEDQKFIDQLLNPQAGSLSEEYQQELSYRFAQEVRLRIQKQYSSVSDFAEKNGLDRHQLSRQLSGTYNLTLKSIARIAAALEEPLMNVCGRPSYRFEEVGLPTFSSSQLSIPFDTADSVEGSEAEESILIASKQNVKHDILESGSVHIGQFEAIPSDGDSIEPGNTSYAMAA